MNTDIELENYCKRFGIPLVFIGTKDTLRNIPHKNGAYIINMDDHTGMGTHWVTFILGLSKKPIYFDSFGVTAPSEIQRWFNGEYLYNTLQIQDLSSGYCGIYCIFFLKYMYEHHHLPTSLRIKKFLNLWGSPSDNLQKLKIYFGL